MTQLAHTAAHRQADLPTLHSALQDQLTRRVDVVAPASKLRALDGNLVIEGVAPMTEMDENGVTITEINGLYRPTVVGDEGVAAKLEIPRGFLGRTRAIEWNPAPEQYDRAGGGTLLYDHTVNAILRTQPDAKYLLRLLRNVDGDPTAYGTDGVVRAFLSNGYRCIDNLDTLLAALDGLASAGMSDGVEVQGDLTERRMIVRVRSTKVAALAPKLLENYRSPFDGRKVGGDWLTPGWVADAAEREGKRYEPGTEPVIFAGFQLVNSEVGNSALGLWPYLGIRICKNGLPLTDDAVRKVHLGVRMDEGGIRWSADTVKANLTLVKRQVQDAVAQWMSPEYLTGAIAKLEAQAGELVQDAPKVIERVSQRLGFTQDEATSILGMFVRGGQMTAGGVMQAVTAHAQTVLDGDRALEIEQSGVEAMNLAAAFAR